MSRITITVDLLPPTVNHMYTTIRGGGKALTDEAQVFRKVVAAAIRRAGFRAAPDGPLSLTMKVVFGNKRRQDLDNRLKAAIDAMSIALGFDDCRIDRIVAERIAGAASSCELTLERREGA